MNIRIEFNPRLDEKQVKKTIKADRIEVRFIDAINRNMGGCRITNYKGEEVYKIIIEEEN